MLSIVFGDCPEELFDVDMYFDTLYEPAWLEDSFVREMILDIDKVVVHSPHCLVSPVIGEQSVYWLSHGVKNLILAYELSDVIIDASGCGDNCAKWLLKISEKKDLVIALHHIMDFSCDFTSKILNDNSVVTKHCDYVTKGVEFI